MNKDPVEIFDAAEDKFRKNADVRLYFTQKEADYIRRILVDHSDVHAVLHAILSNRPTPTRR